MVAAAHLGIWVWYYAVTQDFREYEADDREACAALCDAARDLTQERTGFNHNVQT